jgi:hypothetical protein
MKLSAPLLTALSRCERRFQLEREYRVLRRRPREVFNELLNAALLAMSAGTETRAAAEEMSVRLFEQAASPGFDTAQDPFTLTRDLCAAAHTMLEAISRTQDFEVHKTEPLEDDWEFSALSNGIGDTLERWITVESWDEAERFRQQHSWYVYGDCCAAEQPMRIHVLELGPLRNGHYYSDWVRCYAHPALPNVYRFRRKDGTRLESSWSPVWMQDLYDKDAQDWVNGMKRDHADQMHVLEVARPRPADVRRFKDECAQYRAVISSLGEWQQVPMRRTSCDLPPCPWQAVCYARTFPQVDTLAPFARIRAADSVVVA